MLKLRSYCVSVCLFEEGKSAATLKWANVTIIGDCQKYYKDRFLPGMECAGTECIYRNLHDYTQHIMLPSCAVGIIINTNFPVGNS